MEVEASRNEQQQTAMYGVRSRYIHHHLQQERCPPNAEQPRSSPVMAWAQVAARRGISNCAVCPSSPLTRRVVVHSQGSRSFHTPPSRTKEA